MSEDAAGPRGHDQSHGGFWKLVLGSVGVVYGDIGTSPLYAFKETLNPDHGVPFAALRVICDPAGQALLRQTGAGVGLVVLLVGEGTFHQLHYGATTRAGGIRRTVEPGDETAAPAITSRTLSHSQNMLMATPPSEP